MEGALVGRKRLVSIRFSTLLRSYSAGADLNGTVSDDGLPDPPGEVTTTWSQVSVTGTVTFTDASAVDTTASFSEAGTYVLRLTADDGEMTTSDEVTIVVIGTVIYLPLIFNNSTQ